MKLIKKLSIAMAMPLAIIPTASIAGCKQNKIETYDNTVNFNDKYSYVLNQTNKLNLSFTLNRDLFTDEILDISILNNNNVTIFGMPKVNGKHITFTIQVKNISNYKDETFRFWIKFDSKTTNKNHLISKITDEFVINYKGINPNGIKLISNSNLWSDKGVNEGTFTFSLDRTINSNEVLGIEFKSIHNLTLISKTIIDNTVLIKVKLSNLPSTYENYTDNKCNLTFGYKINNSNILWTKSFDLVFNYMGNDKNGISLSTNSNLWSDKGVNEGTFTFSLNRELKLNETLDVEFNNNSNLIKKDFSINGKEASFKVAIDSIDDVYLNSKNHMFSLNFIYKSANSIIWTKEVKDLVFNYSSKKLSNETQDEYLKNRTISLLTRVRKDTTTWKSIFSWGTGWILDDATPDNPEDYVYYVATNRHVSIAWEQMDEIATQKGYLKNILMWGSSYTQSNYSQWYGYDAALNPYDENGEHDYTGGLSINWYFPIKDTDKFFYEGLNGIDFYIHKIDFTKHIVENKNNLTPLKILNQIKKDTGHINQFAEIDEIEEGNFHLGGFPCDDNDNGMTYFKHNIFPTSEVEYYDYGQLPHNIGDNDTYGKDLSPQIVAGEKPTSWMREGSSGSMLIDDQNQVCGIYWGGFGKTGTTDVMYPCFSLFKTPYKDFTKGYIN